MGHKSGQWDTNLVMGYKSGHGIQIRTWDTNPDMGHKSGHLLMKKKFFIMNFFCLWVISHETFLKTSFKVLSSMCKSLSKIGVPVFEKK